jgi:Protein of unknown function (DUF4232)
MHTRHKRTAGRTGWGLAAGAALLALGACSGSGSAGGATGSAPAASTTPPILSVTPNGSASGAAVATDTGVPGSGLGNCLSAGLKVSTSYDPADNSNGEMDAYIVLTNTSNVACAVYGYAGVDFLDPGGKSLGMSDKRSNSGSVTPVNPVTLAPGQSAAERFTFPFAANDQGNGCETAASVSVIPPNETHALTTRLTSAKLGTIPSFGVCGGTVTLYPFAPASEIPK